MPDLLIRECDVLRLSGDAASVETRQDILVHAGRIAAIRPAGQITAPRDADILAGRGRLAIPGLINTHAHLAMVLFRGLVEDVTIQSWFNEHIWPLEANLTAEDVYWGALLAMAESIEAGVTFVADHYFAMDEVARAAEESGLRAHLSWAIFGHEGPAKIDETSQFIQRWQGKGDGRITTWMGPHAPYTTGLEFLRLAAGRAKELGVGIHTHVSETAEQVKLSLEQSGMTPVQMLAEAGVLEVPTILAHCLYPSDDDLKLLSQSAAGLAHSPKTYLKLGMGISSLERLRQAGIPVGLASDGAVSSNTLDILEQLRLTALAQKHLAGDSTHFPIVRALEVAFHGGAQVLRMGNALGDLAEGKMADIVLLRQDGLHQFPRFDPAANLVYSTRSSDVETVVCNGRILLREGQLLTIDKERVKQEVSQRLERLSQRVPGQRIATYPA